MTTKRYYKKRFWLNTDLSKAAAFWGTVVLDSTVGDPKSEKEWARTDRYDLDGTMEISDCSRTISLDFSLYHGTAKDIRDLREKISRLSTAVSAYAVALNRALDDIEAMSKVKP